MTATGGGSTSSFLVDALQTLSATPAPHGAEGAAAEALVNWGRTTTDVLRWEIDRYGESGANVVVTPARSTGGGGDETALLLVSHLDTSLAGIGEFLVTGRADAPKPFRVAGDVVSGPGLGVARAPAAAALAGFLAAADHLTARDHRPVQLLLAGSGTHRSAMPAVVAASPVKPSSGAGVVHHLAHRPRPAAAVVAKCGPPGLLTAEPGAAYIRLTVLGRMGAAMAPASATPAGGVTLHAGVVLSAVAGWRDSFVAARRGRHDGLAGEIGVGALAAGRADKPDLLPALLELRLYLVTVPGDDPWRLASDLAGFVREALHGTPLAECQVEAEAECLHEAQVTRHDAPVVAAAARAWRRHLPQLPIEILDWTGSTDGVVLRAAGIDTVRFGPQLAVDPLDHRREVLSLSTLHAYASIYKDLVVGFAGSCD